MMHVKIKLCDSRLSLYNAQGLLEQAHSALDTAKTRVNWQGTRIVTLQNGKELYYDSLCLELIEISDYAIQTLTADQREHHKTLVSKVSKLYEIDHSTLNYFTKTLLKIRDFCTKAWFLSSFKKIEDNLSEPHFSTILEKFREDMQQAQFVIDRCRPTTVHLPGRQYPLGQIAKAVTKWLVDSKKHPLAPERQTDLHSIAAVLLNQYDAIEKARLFRPGCAYSDEEMLKLAYELTLTP